LLGREIATGVENAEVVARSSTKPVSFVELSAQERLMLVLEAEVATRPLGAAGVPEDAPEPAL